MTKKGSNKDRLPDELSDRLLAGYEKPEDLTGEDGILKQLTGKRCVTPTPVLA